MRALVIAGLCLLLAAHSVTAVAEESSKVSIYLYGKQAGTTAYGKQFVYEWRYKKYDGRKPAKWVGGDSLEPPRFVVASITFELDGKKVFIPLSAYFDIYDPSVYSVGPYVREDKSSVYLVIDASDGAGAAEVWLKIAQGQYVGRTINAGEQ